MNDIVEKIDKDAEAIATITEMIEQINEKVEGYYIDSFTIKEKEDK